MRMENIFKKTALLMIASAYLLTGWLILMSVIHFAK